MKNLKLIRTVLMAAAVLSMTPAAGAEDLKIGVVNVIKVLDGSPQAQKASKALEREFSTRQKDLTGMQKSLKDMQDKFSKDGATMADTEAQQMERDITTKQRDLRRAQDEYREDFNLRRSEELGKMQKEIIQTIQAVAKEQGFDLVLGDALYASSKADITAAVLDRLRKTGGADTDSAAEDKKSSGTSGAGNAAAAARKPGGAAGDLP
ncbi:MAG TPA: OmpH family outer membrane protein [Gammaproteobacteria bacterium]|nr:OmpH family outer membrane protein [Gammaproteobacteria bacterium]